MWLGLIQALSGLAALFGLGFLIYYGIRLSVSRSKDRQFAPVDRARILGIIATAYGTAMITGLFFDFSTVDAIWLAIAILAGVRSWIWRKRAGQEDAG